MTALFSVHRSQGRTGGLYLCGRERIEFETGNATSDSLHPTSRTRGSTTDWTLLRESFRPRVDSRAATEGSVTWGWRWRPFGRRSRLPLRRWLTGVSCPWRRRAVRHSGPVWRTPDPLCPVPNPLPRNIDNGRRAGRGVRRLDVAPGDRHPDAEQQREGEEGGTARTAAFALESLHPTVSTGRSAGYGWAPRPLRSDRSGACGSRCAPQPSPSRSSAHRPGPIPEPTVVVVDSRARNRGSP